MAINYHQSTNLRKKNDIITFSFKKLRFLLELASVFYCRVFAYTDLTVFFLFFSENCGFFNFYLYLCGAIILFCIAQVSCYQMGKSQKMIVLVKINI